MGIFTLLSGWLPQHWAGLIYFTSY